MRLTVGCKSDRVSAVQNMLQRLGCGPTKVDGVFGLETELAVIRFQENNGLYADGVVGPVMMEALEEAYMYHSLDVDSPGVLSRGRDLEKYYRFERCCALRSEEVRPDRGLDHIWLRADAAEAFNKVRDEVERLGGSLTLSEGKRSLRSRLGPNRSASSFHYLGRAVDLYINDGMYEPKTDLYVVQGTVKEKYGAPCLVNGGPDLSDLPRPDFPVYDLKVYVRRDRPGAEGSANNTLVVTKIENALKCPLDSIHVPNDPVTVEGWYINLTDLFRHNGFETISPRRRFFEAGAALAAEWWHFQFTKGLVKGVSTFGGELLSLYSRETLETTQPWRFRDRTYGIDWF